MELPERRATATTFQDRISIQVADDSVYEYGGIDITINDAWALIIEIIDAIKEATAWREAQRVQQEVST